jgi:hypothetical protein
LIEVKARKGGKLTDLQRQFWLEWQGEGEILRSADDVLDFVKLKHCRL